MARTESASLPAELVALGVRAGEALRGRRWHIGVAESCTGGLLAATLTAAPGSSDFFVGGVIAYDNGVKVRLLGVERGVLDSVGAVSAVVAAAMARGVRRAMGTEVGVGITGVAGPGFDEGGKAAGLIFVAVDAAGSNRVVRLDEDRGRDGNRVHAVRTALTMLLEPT